MSKERCRHFWTSTISTLWLLLLSSIIKKTTRDERKKNEMNNFHLHLLVRVQYKRVFLIYNKKCQYFFFSRIVFKICNKTTILLENYVQEDEDREILISIYFDVALRVQQSEMHFTTWQSASIRSYNFRYKKKIMYGQRKVKLILHSLWIMCDSVSFLTSHFDIF